MWQAVAHTDCTQADWRVTVEGIGSLASYDGPFDTIEQAKVNFEAWYQTDLPRILGVE
jgi:hypothetical protein